MKWGGVERIYSVPNLDMYILLGYHTEMQGYLQTVRERTVCFCVIVIKEEK